MSARFCKPDLDTLGGRLKAERQRLGMSLPAFALLGDVSRSGLVKWEKGSAVPNANALAAFAKAGADVLFIITGKPRAPDPTPQQPLANVTVRQALAMLDPVDRHRLLLDLLAEELSA